MKSGDYVRKLARFIEDEVTEKILIEDLNVLLPNDKFQKIRKSLKDEVLIYLKHQ